MLYIHNINQPPPNLDTKLLNLMTLRLDQLGNIETPLYILETDDVISDIESQLGCPILTNLFNSLTYPDPDFVPSFEVLEDHGDFYEMVFILSDGADAVLIFIPKTEGMDPQLLSLCSEYSIIGDSV
ncbi:MAG: hypothetical protein WCI64_12235 [Chlorobium sp.]